MGGDLMVWQQWVLFIWFCFQVPFGIHREITREHKGIPPEKEERSRTIGIIAYLMVRLVLITLVVTI